MKQNKPVISVIVPIYNAKKYLRTCIDSILSQTYEDFELLLINDGSTDGCNVICDEYALKDTRVKVFHKKNGGVSSARNLGLDNACGEWITFVDSDDYLDESFLAEIRFFEGVDIVVSGVKFINSNKIFSPPMIKKMKIDDDLSFIGIQFSKLYFRAPWAKFFKNDIIQQNKLRFSLDLFCGEDTEFNLRYIQSVKYLGFSSKALYYYNDIDAQFHKYKMNCEQYQRHLSLLLGDLDLLSLKYGYAFSALRGNLKGIFKYLLFLHFVDMKTYASFKREAMSFKKRKCIWYETSPFKQLIKTNVIRYLPFLAYIYFKGLRK